MSKPKVAVVKATPETVLADINTAMHEAEFDRYLDRDKPVILKENISWHLMYPGANTTPWQLEGVIRTLQKAGYNDLVCVANRTVVTQGGKGERLNKLSAVLKRYGVPVKYNFLDTDMKWIKFEPKRSMCVLNRIFPEGIRIPDFFLDKNIVHLPTLKCHIYTNMTGSMKNAFGGLLNSRRHYTHTWIHETLVDLLAIQKEIHSGIFTVTDGTTAGNGPGPRTMVPVEKNYILAGGDSVAIDAVAAKMLGFPPETIDCVRMGDEDGLGCGKLDGIEVMGEDISDVDFGFEVGDNTASRVGDSLWFGPLKPLQKLAFHTPLVYAFILGSFIYHDYVWYPFTGRQHVRKWLNSKWGRLFRQYD